MTNKELLLLPSTDLQERLDEIQADNSLASSKDEEQRILKIQADIANEDNGSSSSSLKIAEVKKSHIRVTGVMIRFAKTGEGFKNSFNVTAVNDKSEALTFSANSNILVSMGYVIGDSDSDYEIIEVSDKSDFNVEYDNQIAQTTGYLENGNMVAHTQSVKSLRLQNLSPSLHFEGAFARNEKVLDAKAEHVILKLNTAEFQKSVASFLVLFISNGVPADKAAVAATAAATAQHTV